MPISSRQSGDTIHLFECGFPTAHQLECGLPNQPDAGACRQLLELADRRTSNDGLADFVVQDQQLADGLSAPVSGAAAMLTTATDTKFIRSMLRC